MPVLKRCKFVRDCERELERRGYAKAMNLPGDYTWRRQSAWFHRRLRLRVEIREGHTLRMLLSNGKWKSSIAKDQNDALEIILAAELDAEFPD